MNAAANYCDKWNLKINTSKTKIMIFSRGKVRRYPIFQFKNEPIEVVDDCLFGSDVQ